MNSMLDEAEDQMSILEDEGEKNPSRAAKRKQN